MKEHNTCNCQFNGFRKLNSNTNSRPNISVKCSLGRVKKASSFGKLIRFISLLLGVQLIVQDGVVGLSQGKSAKSLLTSFSSGIRKMKNDSISTWSYFILKIPFEQRQFGSTIAYKSIFITDLRSSTIVLRASYSCLHSSWTINRRGIKFISSSGLSQQNTGSLAFGLSFTYSIGLSLKSSSSSCNMLQLIRSLIAG